MFTGLSNYSQLVKKDKTLSLEILQEHDNILTNIFQDYFGNVIKHINESIFIEFPSATDATRCALAIQDKLKKFNATSPKDFQINVGLGIHMAEVYEENGDLFGDGINLAARIKSVAGAEEILTTQAVYNSIRSEKDIFVDTRVIAATNKNVKDLISSNKFREDLYHRISVIELNVPKLDDRKDDIPELVSFFLDQISVQYDKNLITIDNKALKKLASYSWPGNVRELRNVVERLIILVESDNITEKDVIKFSGK